MMEKASVFPVRHDEGLIWMEPSPAEQAQARGMHR